MPFSAQFSLLFKQASSTITEEQESNHIVGLSLQFLFTTKAQGRQHIMNTAFF
jgi:hypothetical protein